MYAKVFYPRCTYVFSISEVAIGSQKSLQEIFQTFHSETSVQKVERLTKEIHSQIGGERARQGGGGGPDQVAFCTSARLETL